jgi:hypothetical protein
MISLAPSLALRQIVFFVWVSLTEHKWSLLPSAEEHAGEFDLIHSHYDFMALAYSRPVKTPVLTTIHGSSSPGSPCPGGSG